MEPWLRVCQSLHNGTTKRVRCCGGDLSAVARNEPTQWSWFCHRCKIRKTQRKEYVQITPVVQERWVPTVPHDLQPINEKATQFLLSKGLWPSLIYTPVAVSESTQRLVFDIGSGISLGRSLAPHVQPKWQQYGASSLVRHVGRVGEVTFITEDLLSMFKMQAAMPDTCVATSLGTTVAQEFATLLKTRCRRLVVAYDGDKAGEDGASRLRRYLKPYMEVVTCLAPEGKDPKDMQIREIQEMYGHYRVEGSE